MKISVSELWEIQSRESDEARFLRRNPSLWAMTVAGDACVKHPSGKWYVVVPEPLDPSQVRFTDA